MKTNEKKQGISLIVLVITIIVIVILAVAVILTLANNNPIENAKEAVFKSDIKAMQEELELYISHKFVDKLTTYDATKLYSNKSSLSENDVKVEGKTIKDVIPSIKDKYLDVIQISSGKLIYTGEDNMSELSWADEMLGGKSNLNYAKEEVSDNSSVEIENFSSLKTFRIYGNSIQNGDPSSGTPAEIQSVGIKTQNYTYPISKTDGSGNGIKVEIVGDKFHVYGYPSIEKETWVTLHYNKSDIPAGNYYGKMIIKPRSTNLNSEILTSSHWGGFVNSTHFSAYSGSKISIDTLSSLYLYITASGSKIFTDGEYIDIDVEFMLNEGSSALPYEPYYEGYKIPVKINDTVTNIYLDEPLRKIGNYADYIDFVNKKIVRNIKYKEFTGDETISYYSTTSGNLFRTEFSDSAYGEKTGIALSNRYSVLAQYQRTNYTLSGSGKMYDFINDNYVAATEFKEHLKTLYEAGTPLKVYYSLEKSIEEDVELPTIPINEGTNIIEVDTAISPSKISIIYDQK